MEIIEIISKKEKAKICEDILRALPEWFGIEKSITDYIAGCQSMIFYAAKMDGEIIGFVAIQNHNTHVAEIYVMGVLEHFHRRGIGKMLVGKCEEYCKAARKELLTVKTLDEPDNTTNYGRTMQFYLRIGFRPLDTFPSHWNEENPCLFMAKIIK